MNKKLLLLTVHVLALAATSVVFSPTALHAQGAATGSIQGRVFNPLSREYVNNAEIRLDGTNQVAFTESDGSFRFAGVPLGSASITVNFASYNSVKETLTVTAGQPAVREINLTSTATPTSIAGKDGVVQLQAFTVATESEGNAKAIMAQRKELNIVTSVSSATTIAVSTARSASSGPTTNLSTASMAASWARSPSSIFLPRGS